MSNSSQRFRYVCTAIAISRLALVLRRAPTRGFRHSSFDGDSIGRRTGSAALVQRRRRQQELIDTIAHTVLSQAFEKPELAERDPAEGKKVPVQTLHSVPTALHHVVVCCHRGYMVVPEVANHWKAGLESGNFWPLSDFCAP